MEKKRYKKDAFDEYIAIAIYSLPTVRPMILFLTLCIDAMVTIAREFPTSPQDPMTSTRTPCP